MLEVQWEVRASQTLARSRVVGISAHHVSLDIKAADTGKGDEVNAAVCGFMRSVLGGAAVTVEVIRGYRAPIKTLKVRGGHEWPTRDRGVGPRMAPQPAPEAPRKSDRRCSRAALCGRPARPSAPPRQLRCGRRGLPRRGGRAAARG